MVDSVASIVTLAQVSLVLIKATYNFIRDAQVIDSLVGKLQLSLRDLYKLIKLVELTCKQSRIQENDLSHFIQGALTRCGRRLKGVDVIVHKLAAKKTGTFFRRAALKICSDRAKKDIEEAIGDIKELMDQIHKGISLCILQITSDIDRRITSDIDRRLAALFPAAEADPFETDFQQSVEKEFWSPLSQTLSNVDRDHELALALKHPDRRASSASVYPGPPVLPPKTTTPTTESPKPNWERVDFHYQITKCAGIAARIQAIRTTLQEHAEGSALANSPDELQRSPLHLAAQRGEVKLGEVLLQSSADINAKDSHSCSVLDFAVQYNQEDFVAFLIDHHVDQAAISEKNRDRFEEIQAALELRNK